jgi:hypothetical protein
LSCCLVIVFIGGTFHAVRLLLMIRLPHVQSVPHVTPEQYEVAPSCLVSGRGRTPATR